MGPLLFRHSAQNNLFTKYDRFVHNWAAPRGPATPEFGNIWNLWKKLVRMEENGD